MFDIPSDLVGIVLHPTRLGVDLFVLTLGHGHDPAKAINEGAP
jgi:hypothetical protein